MEYNKSESSAEERRFKIESLRKYRNEKFVDTINRVWSFGMFALICAISYNNGVDIMDVSNTETKTFLISMMGAGMQLGGLFRSAFKFGVVENEIDYIKETFDYELESESRGRSR